jgi:mitogen-activated protein kinase kinase kinase
MAMLASKSPYPTPSLGGGPSQPTSQYTSNVNTYRNHPANARTDQSMFVSPTESEFSEIYDAPDAVRYAAMSVMTRWVADHCRHWDEDKVIDWLKRINCAQYIELFRRMLYPPVSVTGAD